MPINKYLNALKNISHIYDGIKNDLFRKEHVEKIAESRLAICETCKEFDKKGTKCMAPGTQPCCSLCGCSMHWKSRSMASECPAGKWEQLLTPLEEDKLIYNNDEN
jgi:hypothetical protein